jgi:hypothetical protein
VTSIILLSQPVMTVVLSMVLLGESPSPAQLVGVALVIGGIAGATVPIARIRDGIAAGRAQQGERGGLPASFARSGADLSLGSEQLFPNRVVETFASGLPTREIQ